MEEKQTIDGERPQATSLPGALLSSGLVAGLVGVFFSLLGLLYRAGFLSGFVVDASPFLPSSPAELSYWGFVAIVEAWYSAHQRTGTASFWYWVVGSAALSVLIAVVYHVVRRRREARVHVRLFKRALRRSKWAPEAIASVGVLAVASVIPWLGITLAALLIWLPLSSHEAGRQRAEEALTAYAKARAESKASCHVLSGLREPAGDCLFVVAQTKERIVFVDGDRVRIVPAEGVAISWMPSKRRGRKADD